MRENPEAEKEAILFQNMHKKHLYMTQFLLSLNRFWKKAGQTSLIHKMKAFTILRKSAHNVHDSPVPCMKHLNKLLVLYKC